MLIRTKLTQGVQSEPITLAQAKKHMIIETDEDDLLVQAFIGAAREQAQILTGRRYGNQQVSLTFDDSKTCSLFGCGVVSSATVFKRLSTGAWSEVDQTEYELLSTVPAKVIFKNDFAIEYSEFSEKIKIDVSCGETPSFSVQAWMLIRLNSLYENRESDAPEYSNRLLDSDRTNFF